MFFDKPRHVTGKLITNREKNVTKSMGQLKHPLMSMQTRAKRSKEKTRMMDIRTVMEKRQSSVKDQHLKTCIWRSPKHLHYPQPRQSLFHAGWHTSHATFTLPLTQNPSTPNLLISVHLMFLLLN